MGSAAARPRENERPHMVERGIRLLAMGFAVAVGISLTVAAGVSVVSIVHSLTRTHFARRSLHRVVPA